MYRNSAARDASGIRYFNVRFTDEADRLVRRRFKYHGDLSEAVEKSLAGLDESLPICNLRRSTKGARKAMKAPTQIGLPVPLFSQCREFCARRACSMNALINSAIVFHYGGQEIAV